MKPDILMMTSTYPRWSGDREPKFVYDLAKQIGSSDRYRVHVLAPHAAGARLTETVEGVIVHRFRYFPERFQTLCYNGGILARVRKNPLRAMQLPFFVAAEYVALRRLLVQVSFGLVHAHWLLPQGFVAAVAKNRLLGFPPFICTSHGGDLYALRSASMRSVKRAVLSRCDAVTVVSKAMKDECIALGASHASLAVCPMGVELRHTFVPGQSEATGRNLAFVGRLVEKKGVDILLQALPYVLTSYPDATLTVVGDGPEREYLAKLAERKGIADSVKFVGAVNNDSLPDIYRAASVAVFPFTTAVSGDQEGFGLVLVEALGCGCAVVTTDLAVLRDIAENEKTALVVPQRRPELLARAIIRLFGDPALGRRLASAGRAHVLGKFDWTVAADRYLALYDKLIRKTAMVAGSDFCQSPNWPSRR